MSNIYPNYIKLLMLVYLLLWATKWDLVKILSKMNAKRVENIMHKSKSASVLP